jgi:YfiH family protein
VKLLRWHGAPAGYRVAFSTRVGGVSEGPFRSLNIGLLTGDDPDRVVENRRRLCEALRADAGTATMALQVHGARVAEARPLGVVTPGTEYERCDGLWTDRPGHAMLLVTADCFPVALARTNGVRRLAVLHVGWRGLLEGIATRGAAALGEGEVVAAVGPGIGVCCYGVGEEVATPFRQRFGRDVVRGRNLDLGLATERALLEAGVASVERQGGCTACDPNVYFSHRRDRGQTGRQGVIGLLS